MYKLILQKLVLGLGTLWPSYKQPITPVLFDVAPIRDTFAYLLDVHDQRSETLVQGTEPHHGDFATCAKVDFGKNY